MIMHMSRRCGCGAIFSLPSLMSKQASCVACLRKETVVVMEQRKGETAHPARFASTSGPIRGPVTIAGGGQIDVCAVGVAKPEPLVAAAISRDDLRRAVDLLLASKPGETVGWLIGCHSRLTVCKEIFKMASVSWTSGHDRVSAAGRGTLVLAKTESELRGHRFSAGVNLPAWALVDAKPQQSPGERAKVGDVVSWRVKDGNVVRSGRVLGPIWADSGLAVTESPTGHVHMWNVRRAEVAEIVSESPTTKRVDPTRDAIPAPPKTYAEARSLMTQGWWLRLPASASDTTLRIHGGVEQEWRKERARWIDASHGSWSFGGDVPEWTFTPIRPESTA